MRNLKKVLALVIAFSMMLSVVAFAGYNDVDADADYAGAVELLSALDIIKGDDQGNFNPDNTITRAEMAAIICRAKGLEDAATGAMGPTAFTDVAADHWAAGYVNLASQNGIINGYGDGKFGPEDTVTYEQAIKMIVCALGFEPMAASKGGWPTGYLVVANGYKMTAGASVNATRANIAIIVANAMNTPMMDQTSFGSDAKFEVLDDEDNYRTLLTDMDIYVATGVVGEKDADKVSFEIKEVSDDFMFQTVGKKYDFVIGDTNIMEYKNQMVDAYVLETGRNKFEVVAVAPAAISETLVLISDVNEVTVELNDKNEETGVITYFPTGSTKEKEIEVDTKSFTIEYNKVAKASGTKLSDVIDGSADIELTFINNDDDSEFDALVAVKYTSTRVDYVEADRDKIGFDNRVATLDFEDEDKTIILRDADGKELTLADFAEDDVIAVLMDTTTPSTANYIEIVKLTNATVTGTVETTWKDGSIDYVSIDGKDYVNVGDALEPGDEGTFFLGMTGKIIDFEGTTAAGNYGYILEAAQTTEFSKTVWQVRMLTAADGVVVLDVDEDAVADLETILGTLASKKVEDSKVVSAGYVRNGDADKRLVEYEVDSKGNIDEIKACTVDAIKPLSEYNGDTQRIDGKTLADDITVMYIDKANAEDVYTTDISFLVDESAYSGYIFKDTEKKENVVMIVTATDSPFRAEAGFAIVTRVSTAKDAEGNAVTKVDYVQGETEGSVIFNKDSEVAAYETKYDALKLGSMFLFNADADGVVSSYAVIGQYKDGNFALAYKYDEENDEVVYDVAADYAADKYGEDYEIATGYLYHKTNKVVYIAKGKTVNTAADVVEVTVGKAFKYTFNDVIATKAKIELGDYLATAGTEFWSTLDADNQIYATPVVYVTIDGEVVDIYTANKKVEIKDEKGKTTFKKIDTIID